MTPPDVVHSAIAAYFEATNSLDVDTYVDVFAPDGEMHSPPGSAPIVGREAIREVARRLFAPYRAISATADRVFVSGNGAAVVYTARFTSRNGRTATVDGIDVFEVNDDGKIQVARYYWDPTPILALLQEERQDGGLAPQ